MKRNGEVRTVDRSNGFIRGSLERDHMWNASNMKLSRVTTRTLGEGGFPAEWLRPSSPDFWPINVRSRLDPNPPPFPYDISWETF